MAITSAIKLKILDYNIFIDKYFPIQFNLLERKTFSYTLEKAMLG